MNTDPQTILAFESYGPPGRPILLFLHGWPDTAELWQKQIAFFAKDYQCLTVTLPNFPGASLSKWGYDFTQLTDLLAASIRNILQKSNQTSITVIGHDWGAILTYLLDQRYPDLINRVITLDVGAHLKPTTFAHYLFLVSYQWWLVGAFLIGHYLPALGNAMTAWFSTYARAPRGNSVNSQMNYLYFYTWRGILIKKYRSTILRGYRPTKPTLFLYGSRNKYYFFSPRWLEMVAATPNGRVEAMTQSDHWINIREPDRTNALISEWLSK